MRTVGGFEARAGLLRDHVQDRALADEGWVVAPLFDETAVAELHLAYERLARPDDTGLTIDFMRRDRQAVEEVSNVLVPLLDRTLGDLFEPFHVMLTTFVAKHPRGISEMFLHDDRTFVDEREFRAATIWVPLEDVGPGIDNGGLEVVPRSHKLPTGWSGSHTPDLLRPFEKDLRDRLVAVSALVGQAVVYDTRLLHASAPNLGNRTRVAIACSVIPAEARPIHVVATGRRRRVLYLVDREFYVRHHPRDVELSMPSRYAAVEELTDESTIGEDDILAVLGPSPTGPGNRGAVTPLPGDLGELSGARLAIVSRGSVGHPGTDLHLDPGALPPAESIVVEAVHGNAEARRARPADVGCAYLSPWPGEGRWPTEEVDAVVLAPGARARIRSVDHAEIELVVVEAPTFGAGAADRALTLSLDIGDQIVARGDGPLVWNDGPGQLLMFAWQRASAGPIPVTYFVRTEGTWLRTTVPGTESEVVDLEDILSELPQHPPARPRTTPMGTQAPEVERGVDGAIAPWWVIVGRACSDGLVLERSGGAQVLLTPADLALLDRIPGPMTLADLLHGAADDGEAIGRVRRMILEGPLEQSSVPSSPSESFTPAAAERPDPPPAPRSVEAVANRTGDRIPVYAVWQEKVGPVLALGMLTAAARMHDGGRLNGAFEIRRPELADDFLADLSSRRGPGILLCSNYVWSLDDNLRLARMARTLNPQLIVVHGGPSAPGYADDAAEFLRSNADVADVIVRGEGEVTLCELLDALAKSGGQIDRDLLGGVAGLTFADGRGGVVRTADRARATDLDLLPSPYLCGEFDHIDPAAWHYCVSLETNRGCPYSCSFCDWGSATNSRVRKFSLDRVLAEIDWAVDRGIDGIQICDANFGITSRDVDIAAAMALRRSERDLPRVVAFTPAKNTTRHLARIFDHLTDAGVLISTAISLQTIDERTLEVVNRQNISTDAYLALAAELRRRGQPFEGDVLLGLPGQTFESYKRDLQFFLDHDITPRTWSLRLLPNAPMNDSSYRAQWDIQANEDRIVTSTSTMSVEDRTRMRLLRRVQVVSHRFGVLGYLSRFLQWDRGLPVMDLVEALAEMITTAPDSYPEISWLFSYFDLFAGPASGWGGFFREVRRFLRDRFGLEPAADLECAIVLQEFVLPAPGRRLPATVTLAHDFVAYHLDATRPLFVDGSPGRPVKPLAEYAQAEFEVTGPPVGTAGDGMRFSGNSRDEALEGNFWLGIGYSYELGSALRRGRGDIAAELAAIADAGLLPDHPKEPGDSPVPVRLVARNSR